MKQGVIGPANKQEMREAVERVSEFLLLEVEDDEDEMQIDALVQGSKDPTLPAMGPPDIPMVPSSSCDVDSSDDEFFDALEIIPYDPIADGFFE